MKKYQNVGVSVLSAGILALLAAVPARAFIPIPVVDVESTRNSIQTTLTSIKETKFITDATKVANETSATIGKAKKTMSEYAADEVKKAQELQKKVEKRKKQIEAYQKQAKEYQSLVEEKVDEAKQTANSAKETYNQAQDTYNQAKETASAVTEAAGDKLNAAKEKVSPSGNVPAAAEQTASDTAPTTPSTTRQTFDSSATGVTSSAVSGTANDVLMKTEIQKPTEKAVNTLPQQTVEKMPVAEKAVTVKQNVSDTVSTTPSTTRRTFGVPYSAVMTPYSAYATAGHSETLAFADILSSDGGYSEDGDGIPVFPMELALECGLSSDDAKKDTAITDCLDKICEKYKGNQQERSTAMTLMAKIVKSQAAYNIARAIKIQADAAAFEKNVQEGIDNAAQKATTSRDDTSATTAAITAGADLLNQLNMLQSGIMALEAMDGYCK